MIKFLTKLDKTTIKNNNICYYQDDLDEIRGLYNSETDDIFVNLGAKSFISSLKIPKVNEEVFIEILSNTITHIRTPNAFVEEKEYLLDFLRNCDSETYIAVRDYNASLKAQTEIKPLKIRCIHCQNEYDQQFTLNTSDFFG